MAQQLRLGRNSVLDVTRTNLRGHQEIIDYRRLDHDRWDRMPTTFRPCAARRLSRSENQRFQFGFEIECDPLEFIEKTGLMSRGMASSMPLRAG